MRSFIKRILSALALAGTLATPALSAGTIPLAMSVQFDLQGNPARGCLLYLYVAGTVATPQAVYQDFGLTIPAANPLSCDNSGRLPLFWLADGTIHPRLTDSGGVIIVDVPVMQVLGPSTGGASGGATIDPTTIMSVGDTKFRPTNDVL